jgi:hypothetical protein
LIFPTLIDNSARLHRSHSQGRHASPVAGVAAYEIRIRNQSQNREAIGAKISDNLLSLADEVIE